MNNSSLPDHLKPIYIIVASGKFNDTYLDICEKWSFEDLMFANQFLSDLSLIENMK